MPTLREEERGGRKAQARTNEGAWADESTPNTDALFGICDVTEGGNGG